MRYGAESRIGDEEYAPWSQSRGYPKPCQCARYWGHAMILIGMNARWRHRGDLCTRLSASEVPVSTACQAGGMPHAPPTGN